MGTQVTFMTRGDKFLPREDRDAAFFLMNQLVNDGARFMFNTTTTGIS